MELLLKHKNIDINVENEIHFQNLIGLQLLFNDFFLISIGKNHLISQVIVRKRNH